MHHLLQHAHWKSSGTTGWVQNLAVIERLHDLFLLLFSKVNSLVCILHQLTVLSFKVIAYGAFEVSNQTFVHHILHNLSRGIERAGLFSGCSLRFWIIGCKQILEHFAQQFRVE